jgi:hypothetical protein
MRLGAQILACGELIPYAQSSSTLQSYRTGEYTPMAYRTSLTLAALLVSTSIAGPALAQAVQTRTYDYEWLYFELPRFEEDTLAGKLFLEDVSSTGGVNARSVVDAEIFARND